MGTCREELILYDGLAENDLIRYIPVKDRMLFLKTQGLVLNRLLF